MTTLLKIQDSYKHINYFWGQYANMASRLEIYTNLQHNRYRNTKERKKQNNWRWKLSCRSEKQPIVNQWNRTIAHLIFKTDYEQFHSISFNSDGQESCRLIECFLFGEAIKAIKSAKIIIRNNFDDSSNNCIVFRKCLSAERCHKTSNTTRPKRVLMNTHKIGSVSSATTSISHFAKSATGVECS